MRYRFGELLFALLAVTLLGSTCLAQTPAKQIATVKNKPVVLGNFLNAPANCGTNPGPVPLLKLHERPSHGTVALQIVVADVAATDSCPARKMPSLALFYTPARDYVGIDSVQVEFETGDQRLPMLAFQITTQEPADSK